MSPLLLAALFASATGASKNVTATLLAEKDAVEPGRPLVVALRLHMAPQWHTYWKNPGDAGLATRVQWSLPDGFRAGPLQWPRPERMPADPLMSYGYAGEVLLLTEIATPAKIAGREVAIGARVSWLECRDVCLPGKAALELTLPVSAGARPGPEAAAFGQSRDRMPRVLPGLRVLGTARGTELVLALSGAPPARTAYFYPAAPGVVEHGAPQKLSSEKGALRLVLQRASNAAPAPALEGVLELDDKAYEIRAAPAK